MSPFEHAHPALDSALTKRGYTALTPVQSAVLDENLKDRDLLVSAQTGSGKTVAFGLALAGTILAEEARLGAGRLPLALIIAPTRELALQVSRELAWLYGEAGARISTCVGGMDPRAERRALERGADIVVGTPGRLRDHITRRALDLSELRAAVLDEADEMLDLGFREDLEFILDAAPVERRTLMFSATLPREVIALAKRFQKNAERISVNSERSAHADIEYIGHTVIASERENAIINVLRYHNTTRSIVFCGTRENVKHLTARLGNRGFSTVALSGEFTQAERTHALQSIRDGRANVCVATDVAARGIDLPELDLVIHADLPNNADTLLHRSGRTGRAGRKGVCALVVTNARKRAAERLIRLAKVDIKWVPTPNASDIARLDNERIIESPFLKDEMDADERGFAEALLKNHSAEQVAAAFYRLSRSNLPAAEDLSDIPEYKTRDRADRSERPGRRDRPDRQERPDRHDRHEKKPNLRNDFDNGGWFRISAGRKQRAEPRWLLPIICRSGGVDRNSVGAISIRDGETLFEIHPDKVESYQQMVGEQGCVERTLKIAFVGKGDQAASGESSGSAAQTDRSRSDKPRSDKPRSDKTRSNKPHKKSKPKRQDDVPPVEDITDTRSAKAKKFKARKRPLTPDS